MRIRRRPSSGLTPSSMPASVIGSSPRNSRTAHEKLVDPGYHPGIRRAPGIVKVKLANVESRLLVQQTQMGEDPHLVKVKNVDIIDYLAHLATRENPQWRGIGSPGIPRPTVTSSREPWTL